MPRAARAAGRKIGPGIKGRGTGDLWTSRTAGRGRGSRAARRRDREEFPGDRRRSAGKGLSRTGEDGRLGGPRARSRERAETKDKEIAAAPTPYG